MTFLACVLLASELTSGGLVWSLPGQLGQAEVVIADRGGQVLASNFTLLSSFDSDPPSPVWQLWAGGAGRAVAARDTDVFLTSEIVKVGASTGLCVVTKNTSSSAAPAWTQGVESGFVAVVEAKISRDGSVIIASVGRFDTPTSNLFVLDPGTGAVIQTYVVPAPFYRLALSPDGSVAAFSDASVPMRTRVIDISTGGELFSTLGTVTRTQAVSDQGRVLLVQERRSGVTYSRAFVRESNTYRAIFEVRTATGQPNEMAVSDDGSVVAGAWVVRGSPSQLVIRAFDVATGAISMERVLPPSFVGGLAISSDGQRFVVGGGGTSKLAVYSPTSSVPLVEYPDGGAVTDVDLSPDGKRFVASRSRAGSYSSVELYELGGEDLVVRGRPSIGETIEFELHAPPGANAFLLSAPDIAPDPLVIPGIGTLFLAPRFLQISPIGVVPASGVVSHAFPIADDPALVGRKTYYQGFTTEPRTLSTDWVQLTILP